MRILFQYEKARRVSSELLALSRTVRQSAYEAEDAMRNLRLETEFAPCRQELQRQGEALALLTARLVSLSSALNEIASLYYRVEEQNTDRLGDGANSFYLPVPSGTLYQSGEDTHARMEQVLYP